MLMCFIVFFEQIEADSLYLYCVLLVNPYFIASFCLLSFLMLTNSFILYYSIMLMSMFCKMAQ